jgi:Asp-tRNA(Asn)/Glu-tRNA(Gln) amidotransferase A subunit family amidase
MRNGKQRGRSPLHGIPVVLKDNYNTADLPTTGGSVLLEGSIPSADAFVVEKLRDAGAIILAKMNMSEFASPPSQPELRGCKDAELFIQAVGRGDARAKDVRENQND